MAARLLTADFTNTVLFCEEARKRLLAARRRHALCVFSSVAGERGRKPVILYGAAKAGCRATWKGWTTSSAPRAEDGVREARLCEDRHDGRTEAAAVCRHARRKCARVLRAIDRGRPEVYVPAAWRWVMCVIRALPRLVMRRFKF